DARLAHSRVETAITAKTISMRAKLESDMLDKINQASTIKSLIGIKKDINNLEVGQTIKDTLLKAADDRRLKLSDEFHTKLRADIDKTSKTELEAKIAGIKASFIKTKIEIQNKKLEEEAAGATVDQLQKYDDALEAATNANIDAILNVKDTATKKELSNKQKANLDLLKHEQSLAKEHMSLLKKTDEARISQVRQVTRIKSTIETIEREQLRNTLYELAERSITDEEELASRKKYIDEQLNQARIDSGRNANAEIEKANQEHFDATAKQINDFAQDIIKGVDALTQSISKTTVKEFSSLGKALGDTLTAYLTHLPGAIMSAAASWISLFDDLLSYTERKEEERKKKLEALRDEMKQIASSIGQEIGQAMSSSMFVDFDKLVKDFVRADVARTIASVISMSFGEEMKNIRRTIEATAGGGEEHEQMIDRLSDKLVSFRDDNLVKNLSKYFTEKDIPMTAFRSILKDIRALGPTPTKAEWEVIARKIIQARYGMNTLSSSLDNLKSIWDDKKGELGEVINTIGDTFDFISDKSGVLSEQLPASTFRAVTEPTANQMLLLMGRQVDLLQSIKENTSRLANIESVLSRGVTSNNAPSTTVVTNPASAPAVNAVELFQTQDTMVRNRRTAIGRTRIKSKALR
ncbi:MAG: hypothetical protein ABH884_04000, partial [Candidatus Komeilibacteria bacterium]